MDKSYELNLPALYYFVNNVYDVIRLIYVDPVYVDCCYVGANL